MVLRRARGFRPENFIAVQKLSVLESISKNTGLGSIAEFNMWLYSSAKSTHSIIYILIKIEIEFDLFPLLLPCFLLIWCNSLFRNVLLLLVCIFPTVSYLLCKHGFVGSSVHMLAFKILCSWLLNTNIILGSFSVFKIISSVNSVYIQPLRGILHSWIFWTLQLALSNMTNHKLNQAEIFTFLFLNCSCPCLTFSHPL